MNGAYYLKRCKSSIITVFLVIIVSWSEGANILAVFPTPFLSHHAVFRPFVNELVSRGHQITVITTDPQFKKGQGSKNLTEIDVHDVSYNIWNNQIRLAYPYETINAIFEEQLKSFAVQELLHDNKTFDLLILESCMRPAIGFSYRYKAPVIEISSLGPIHQTLDLTGAPSNELAYPQALSRRIINLSIWEKVSELYEQYKINRFYSELENEENKMLQRYFGRDIPGISELKKNVQLTFLNANPMWDFNRPVPPNVIYLGGMNKNTAKQIPKDLIYFLDSSKSGVIYMSFGTNIKPSELPSKKEQIFKKVFSQLPYNILWKWDKEEVPSENVRMSKWFPQSELLKHPKVMLFITQGGLQSTDEAITTGVPLIGIPMTTDQYFNAEMYINHDIGLKLDMNGITEDIFKNAIETVIENPKYRQNIKKLRAIMYDKTQSSLERAVWWTEYVLRHGNAEHLKSPASYIHWTEYYAFAFAILSLSLSIVVLTSSVYVIRFILSQLATSVILKKIFVFVKTKIK